MSKMILHCGGHEVDRAALGQVPMPQQTNSYCPISHADFVDGVERSLLAAGFQIEAMGHALARNGMNYFGTMELRNGHDADDYATIVGLRNSHGKVFPAGLACGGRVFVCDNLSFSGEIVIKRRHTRFIKRDLPQLIDAAVGRLGMLRTDQATRIATYKDRQLDVDFADHLIIELLRARVITSTKIPTVLKEWEEPSHEEFARDGFTAWRFFNAVTESLKGRIPEPRVTQALHGIMDAACGGVVLEGDYSEIH